MDAFLIHLIVRAAHELILVRMILWCTRGWSARAVFRGAYGVVAHFVNGPGQGLAVKRIKNVFNCKNGDYAALVEVHRYSFQAVLEIFG